MTSTIKASVAYEFKKRIDMRYVTTLVLAGGIGTRLYPLTLSRCKPALCFGGNYRLIDVALSNALHAGCKKIYILTQFLATSLHRHVLKAYDSIGLLSAEQKPSRSHWYQGTADAVRQNMEYLLECEADYFLILSGDQLYQMNFEDMAAYAEKTDADLVIASLPVDQKTAKRMGILKIDSEKRIFDFHEKPEEEEVLESLKNYDNPQKPFLGSMGIYLFKRKVLLNLLKEDSREDFGKHLIPTQVKKGNVRAFIYNGYWEDIGTIESFYNANMDLTTECPAFDISSQHFPIHTAFLGLSPSNIRNSEIKDSLICEGSTIIEGTLINSIIGPSSRIGKGTEIQTSYLFGNDRRPEDSESFSIGEDCVIKKALIDKNVKIGNGVKLINQSGLKTYDSDKIHIRDGVIIVNRGASLPDYFTL